MTGTFFYLTIVQWYGVILIAIGLLIHFCIFHLRFKRRNAYGVEVFSKSFKAWIVPKLEYLVKLLERACITYGIFLILIEVFNRS